MNNVSRSTLSTHFTTPKFVICPHLNGVRGKKVRFFTGLCDNSQQHSLFNHTKERREEIAPISLLTLPLLFIISRVTCKKRKSYPHFSSRSAIVLSVLGQRTKKEERFHSNSQTQQNHSALLDPGIPERNQPPEPTRLEERDNNATSQNSCLTLFLLLVVIRRFSFVWKHPP